MELLIRFFLFAAIYLCSVMVLAYYIAIKMMKKHQKKLDELINENKQNAKH